MAIHERLLLWHSRSPGDVVCMTAAIRDLVEGHPGEYEVHVKTECSELWVNNPHIAGHHVGSWPRKGLRTIKFPERTLLQAANTSRRHYLTSFHRVISNELGIDVRVRHPHGDLHLDDQERERVTDSRPYWFFVAGGKSDMLTKVWPANYSQILVNSLRNHGLRVVQGGATNPGHWHPALEGVDSVVGKTSGREFVRWIYHAAGIICPITFAMHLAAAFNKPCVVIAGGREPYWWEHYANLPERHFGEHCTPVRTPHRYLHTIGQMDCCLQTGCWKSMLSLMTPQREHDCRYPVEAGTGAVKLSPMCLHSITPEMVLAAVLSYYEDGTLKSE